MTSFMHKPSVAGQSIVDRALAAKHTVSGSGVAKVVCKATTEEVMGPKRKHLDYLLHCTNDSNISIPQLANLLIDRTQNSSWVVVFKAMVTIHNLMNYGNERFTQYLASNNCHLNLANFTDRSSSLGYSMSVFIRRYARYLNQKASSYRVMAFDFCKVKRGKEDGLLRTMNTEKLLKTLPMVQNQLDALVEFEVDVNDLTNGVINGCFMLMFKDLIRLFACYNDGIINLLEKYFDMNKKQCKDALDLYKKFITRTDRVCACLKVAENVGIDKGDIPDLAKAPSSLLEALEQHLISLENVKKVSTTPSSTSTSSTAVANPRPTAGVTAAISTYRTEAERGVAPGAGASLSDIDEQQRAQLLEDEERLLEQMRQRKLNQLQQQPVAAAQLSAPAPQKPAAASSVLSSSSSSVQQTSSSFTAVPSINDPAFIEFADNFAASSAKHSSDLLGLDGLGGSSRTPVNSFNAFNGGYNNAAPINGSAGFAANNPFVAGSTGNSADLNFGASWSGGQTSMNNDFIGSSYHAGLSAMPPSPASGLDLFGGSGVGGSTASLTMLQPISSKPSAVGGPFLNQSRTAPSSAPMSPANSSAVSSALTNSKTDKLIQSHDIDSSLANLAGNLTVKSAYMKKSEHQWKGDTSEKKLTGGANISSSGTGWASNIGSTPAVNASPIYWNNQTSPYPQIQPAYPMLGGAMPPQAVMSGPPLGAYAVPMGAPMMYVQPQVGWSQPPAPAVIQQQHQQQLPANDPFGAL